MRCALFMLIMIGNFLYFISIELFFFHLIFVRLQFQKAIPFRKGILRARQSVESKTKTMMM